MLFTYTIRGYRKTPTLFSPAKIVDIKLNFYLFCPVLVLFCSIIELLTRHKCRFRCPLDINVSFPIPSITDICRNVKLQVLNLALSAILEVVLAEKYIRSTVSRDG
jgi:hypothetical protein